MSWDQKNVPHKGWVCDFVTDLGTPDGSRIPIEERSSREVTHVGGARVAPEGARVWNPAFDVTPHQLISGIITERGVFRQPYTETLKRAFEKEAVC